MTIAELIREMIDTAKERAKTPIAGSFALAFLIYNWRPIFLLMFSSASIEDKITVVNDQYCNFWAVAIPVLLAIFYVAGVQYIMLVLDNLTLYAYNKRKVTTYKKKAHDLKEFREVLKEQRENELIRSGNMERAQLNDQIEKLKVDVQNAQDDLSKEKKDNKVAWDVHQATLDTSNSKNTLLIEKITHYEKLNEYLLDLTPIVPVLDVLDESELKNFVKFVDFYVDRTRDGVVITDYEDKYIDLHLIEKSGNTYTTTDTGRKLYEYLLIKYKD